MNNQPQALEAPVCQCCRRALHGAPGRLVCARCEDRIAAGLAEAATLWEQLPDHRTKGTAGPADDQAVRTPGPPGSQAPGDLTAISLLAGGTVGALIVHEDAWRRALGWTVTPWRGDQDQTLTGVLRFLTGNLPWACRAYDAVDDLDQDLTRLLREMRAVVTGDRRRPRPLPATCPLPAGGEDDEGPEPVACGGQLAYDPVKSRIYCRTCRHTLGYEHWAALGLAVGLLAEPTPTAA